MTLRLRGLFTMVAAVLLAGACGAQFSDEEALRAAADEMERTGLADAGAGGAAASASARSTGSDVDATSAAGAGETAKSGEAVVAGKTASNPAASTSEPAVGPTISEPQGVVKAVEPRCVERPGAVTITIQTGKLADVAYGASFADGDHHNQWGLGQADLEGRFVWNVVVGADIPDGVATVVVGSSNVEGQGGPGGGQFLVAGKGGC